MDKKEQTYKEILNKLNLNIKHYQLTKNIYTNLNLSIVIWIQD